MQNQLTVDIEKIKKYINVIALTFDIYITRKKKYCFPFMTYFVKHKLIFEIPQECPYQSL